MGAHEPRLPGRKGDLILWTGATFLWIVSIEHGLRTCGTCAQNGKRKDFFVSRHSLLFQFLLSDQRVYIVQNMCVYVCVCIYIYVHTHISDTVQTVYELPLVPSNTATKHFTQIGAVRSVDWLFIVGAPVWRWMGEYVTLDRTFYSLLFKQEVAAVLLLPCHIPRRRLY